MNTSVKEGTQLCEMQETLQLSAARDSQLRKYNKKKISEEPRNAGTPITSFSWLPGFLRFLFLHLDEVLQMQVNFPYRGGGSPANTYRRVIEPPKGVLHDVEPPEPKCIRNFNDA